MTSVEEQPAKETPDGHDHESGADGVNDDRCVIERVVLTVVVAPPGNVDHVPRTRLLFREDDVSGIAPVHGRRLAEVDGATVAAVGTRERRLTVGRIGRKGPRLQVIVGHHPPRARGPEAADDLSMPVRRRG